MLGTQNRGRGVSVDVQVGIRSAVQGTKSLAGVFGLGQLEGRENVIYFKQF